MPKVSVLMSVYNSEHYLPEAIESILAQTFPDFEFIIVNDGSTDRSADIVASYSDPRICYVENEQNFGLTYSLNYALSLAQSPYVARMDADDVSLPERLSEQVNYLDNHPDMGVVGSWIQPIDMDGNTGETWEFPTESNFIKWCLIFYNPIVHPTVMMRRKIVIQAGGYNSKIIQAQDYDLWQRLSRVTRLSNLPKPLLYLRKHNASISSRYMVQQIKTGLTVSQRMMADILKEEVPGEIVQQLWKWSLAADLEPQQFQTIFAEDKGVKGKSLLSSHDLRRVARLIYQLCQAMSKNREVSANEKQMIRANAAAQMMAMIRPVIYDMRLWPILLWAGQLDPRVVKTELKESLRRTFYQFIPHKGLG